MCMSAKGPFTVCFPLPISTLCVPKHFLYLYYCFGIEIHEMFKIPSSRWRKHRYSEFSTFNIDLNGLTLADIQKQRIICFFNPL